MANQLKQLPVTLFAGQGRPIELQHSTVVMLEAAISLFKKLKDQLVAVPCGGRRPHQITGGLANALDIRDEALRPTKGRRANQEKFMPMAMNRERLDPKRTGMQRGIDQRIEIFGKPTLKGRFERQMHLPVGGS